MKRTRASAWIAFALWLSLSCRKEQGVYQPPEKSIISEARAFFTSNIDQLAPPAPGSAAALSARTVHWEEATVANNGKTVIVPLSYASPQFLTLRDTRPLYFSIDNVSQLLLTRDTAGGFDAVVQQRIPDSAYLSHPDGSFTGTVFQETWQGNALPTLRVSPAKVTGRAAAQDIIVCTTIYGYNYAPSDPGAGYSWSRTTCVFMNLPVTQEGGSGGGTGGGGGGGGGGGTTTPASGSAGSSRPVPLYKTIRVFAPDQIIASVPDYLHCFTGSPSATYQVKICVAQPKPGSRTTWGIAQPTDAMTTGNPVEVGHTFLVLTQDNGGGNQIIRNIGFYPSETILPWTGNVRSVFNNDGMHHYNIAATFNVSASNFMAIVNYINSVRNNPYNLSTFNCTTFALDAIEQGHIYLPRVIGSWAGGMGNDPGDLGEDIRNSNAPGIQKDTQNGIHNNQGSCN